MKINRDLDRIKISDIFFYGVQHNFIISDIVYYNKFIIINKDFCKKTDVFWSFRDAWRAGLEPNSWLAAIRRYANMPTQNLKFGQTLKSRRLSKGLNLEQLSHLSGVSKAMLSQVEQNKVNPTLVVMLKIVDALQMDLADVLKRKSRSNIFRIIPADEEHYIFRSDNLCTIRTLNPLSLEKSIEFYKITFEANGRIMSEPHYPGTEEFLHLAGGRLEVSSGHQKTILRKGDSIHYRADVPHGLKNLSKSRAEAFIVVRYQNE
jgi:transcriptional regulator with XRE-family HTH domain